MMTPARLCDLHRHCPCGCRSLDRARPGWLAELPADSRAVHDAWLRRELLLWEACVWRPESAEAAAAWRRVLLATIQLRNAMRAAQARVRALVARVLLPAVVCDELATVADRAPPRRVPAAGRLTVIPP